MIEKFSIDFASLEKGTNILADEISRIFGVPIGSQEFHFKLLQLKEEIENNRLDLVVKQEANGIRIMTDLEASEYTEQRTRTLVGSLRRVAKRTTRIDTSNFTEHQKRIHESRERLTSGVAMAAHRAERSLYKEISGIRLRMIAGGDDSEE